MSGHEDATDPMAADPQAPPPAADGELLGGTALGALPGSQPPEDGLVARPLDPGESPLLAPLLGTAAASGGYFSIDLERAPQAIADLNAAAQYLRDRAQTAVLLTNIPPPGIDGISLHAVDEIGRWGAGDDVNNLAATLRAGAQQLSSFAARLEHDVSVYLNTDELELPPANPGLSA